MQAGATFAALGALTVATAVPANAGVYQYGWAGANVAGNWDSWASSTDVTMHESSDSDSFSVAVDDYLTIDAETSASVNAQGATATTVVNSARLQVTTDDLDAILEEAEESDDEDDEETDEPSEEPSSTPSEGGTDTEGDGETDSDGSEGEGSEGDDAEGDGSDDSEGSEGSEGDGEAPSPSPTAEPGEGDGASDESASDDEEAEESAPEAEQTQEPEAAGADEVVTLDETNSELTDGGDEVVLDVTISGMTITTTQTWGGEVSRSFEPGSVSESVNLLDAEVDIFSDEGVDEMTDEGVVWSDAYTVGLVTFTVPEVAYATYPLGVTYASVTDEMYEGGEGDGGQDGDGNGGQDGSGDEGDDKNPPAEREKPEPKPEQQRSVEPLAQTGSPVVGLIAAGAAVAAGGGLAAFFARRKKTATAAADESSEG